MKRLIFLILTSIALPVTLIVPTDYPNIQAGVDAAVSGDTVLVLDGVYSGEGNYDILIGEPYGREILLISESGPENCIIDCQEFGYGFFVVGIGELLIKGFTIENCTSINGGGIHISVTFFGSPIIENCIILNNNASEFGGGVFIEGSNPIIKNCLFVNNNASFGNGLALGGWANVYIYNSIIFDELIDGNEGVHTEYYCLYTPAAVPIDFNNSFNYIIGDPMFTDLEGEDFQLKWESPCINSGDPDFPLDPDSTRIDIGPLYYHLELLGDINFDEIINVLDIVLSINIILEEIVPFNAQVWAGDLNGDNGINILDIILIVNIILEVTPRTE